MTIVHTLDNIRDRPWRIKL